MPGSVKRAIFALDGVIRDNIRTAEEPTNSHDVRTSALASAVSSLCDVLKMLLKESSEP